MILDDWLQKRLEKLCKVRLDKFNSRKKKKMKLKYSEQGETSRERHTKEYLKIF